MLSEDSCDASRADFHSKNCMRELVSTTTMVKPVIALIDTDTSRGGLSLTEVHTQLLEADESYEKWGFDTDAAPHGQALYSHLFASNPIEWNRAQPTALQRRSAPTTQPPGACLQEVLACAQVLATSRM